VEFITKDALEFVSCTNQQFDLITVDIFIDDITPDAFIQRDFMKKLRNLLKKNGLLLFSKLHYTSSQKKANQLFAAQFSDVFPKSFSISAAYNMMYAYIKDS
jgi:spermidine synthase